MQKTFSSVSTKTISYLLLFGCLLLLVVISTLRLQFFGTSSSSSSQHHSSSSTTDTNNSGTSLDENQQEEQVVKQHQQQQQKNKNKKPPSLFEKKEQQQQQQIFVRCPSGNIVMLKNSQKRATATTAIWKSPFPSSFSLTTKFSSIQQLAQFFQQPSSSSEKYSADQKLLFSQTEFQSIFRIDYEHGKLRIPSKRIRGEALKMFALFPKKKNNKNNEGGKNNDDDDDAASHITGQHLVATTNLVTSDTSLFNDLRNYRPGAVRRISEEEEEKINNPMTISPDDGSINHKKCHFCEGMNHTTEDIFGRIIGKHSYTASNIAKVCPWHGLLINNRHHPLQFTPEEVADWFHVARSWFKSANKIDPKARFPHIMYDAGSRASASQQHLHLQLMLSRHQYFTHANRLVQAANQFSFCLNNDDKNNEKNKNNKNSDFWTEWIRSHEAVGLALHHEGSWLLVSLTPVHDKEMIIIGNSALLSFSQLYYFAITVLLKSKRLNVRAFSAGAFLESFPVENNKNKNENQNNYNYNNPAVARVMDRGSPLDVRSDVGAMEFYGANNVATDPYVVMGEVEKMWKIEKMKFS